MKNFITSLLVIISILILIYILSPDARRWLCNMWNKMKNKGANCSNCETFAKGIIVGGGQCTPQTQVAYDKCIQDNIALKDGADCIGCGNNPSGILAEDFSGNGVIVSGRCMALPDAFAGKICVPQSAPVNSIPLSYKRELISADVYKYFKTPSNTIKQTETLSDTEISRQDYINAFVQTIADCPVGQIKV